jgi:hypothetical protein
LGFTNDDDFEFVELLNIGTATVDLSGAGWTDGIDFQFNSGSILRLEPGERLLLVSNQEAFEARYGTGLPVAALRRGEFAYGGRLRGGEPSLSLPTGPRRPVKRTVGRSLERIAPEEAATQRAAENWMASGELGGTPGRGPGGSPGYGAWLNRSSR